VALIKCVECGKEISSRAHACTGCGCPVQFDLESGEVQPLVGEGGKNKIGFSYLGKLQGYCPKCNVERSFSASTMGELAAIGLEDMNDFGQGSWLKSVTNGIIRDVISLLKRSKIALLYKCDDCQTFYWVCRSCMKPNIRHVGQPHCCNHCGLPMITS